MADKLTHLLTLHGAHLCALTQMIQSQVLKLRLVSKDIKMYLESNKFLIVKFSVTEAGVQQLKSDFLVRWQGYLHLYCKQQWKPESPCFLEFKAALVLYREEPIKLKVLGLIVEGQGLNLLAEQLKDIRPRLEQLSVSYRGKSEDLIAAAAESHFSMFRAATIEISIDGIDPGGNKTYTWLQRLHEMKIDLASVTIRFFPHPA